MKKEGKIKQVKKKKEWWKVVKERKSGKNE